MYRVAYKGADETVFYFDSAGNKYVAAGGSLAWRLNNPGLVHRRCLLAYHKGVIGTYGPFAIFSNPKEGHEALAAWLGLKKYRQAPLRAVAQHYRPEDPEAFAHQLSTLANVSQDTLVKSLSLQELDRLLLSIEKLCGYGLSGNESFSLLPKIIAKIENEKDGEDAYLIGSNLVLSKRESIEWVHTNRLDAIIVHEENGGVYLRSRPNHRIWNVKTHEGELPPLFEGKIEVLVRTVGERRPGQCIWGFINGINNTKEEALESARRISQAAGGDVVFSMPNDTAWFCVKDGTVSFALKFLGNTPIVSWAAQFFRFLLDLAKKDSSQPPIVIFAHSQGAIIAEHALELLDKNERERLIIFTFGGGSFISPGKSHPDSHNYASATDFVCRICSPNLQYLALQRYFGGKNGQNQQEVAYQLASLDAMLNLDTTDLKAIEAFTQQRAEHYEKEFTKIGNVTVLDPDPKCRHAFENSCYQSALQTIVKKYQHR